MHSNANYALGDYNLAALDYLPKCELHWVGNCNELNAGMVDKNCFMFLVAIRLRI